MLRGWHLADFHAPALSAYRNSGIKEKVRSFTDFSLCLFYKIIFPIHKSADVSKTSTFKVCHPRCVCNSLGGRRIVKQHN